MANSSAPLPCCHPHQGLLEVALLHHHRLAPLAQQSFQRGPKLAWSLLPLLTSLRDGDLNLEDGVCLWLSVAQLKSLKLVPFSHIAISKICLNLTLISERSSLSFQAVQIVQPVQTQRQLQPLHLGQLLLEASEIRGMLISLIMGVL